MRKFSFICEDSQNKTVIEFNSIDLNYAVQKFEQFLKGVGYVYKGKLSFNIPQAAQTAPNENYTLKGSGASYASQSNPEITSITISPTEKGLIGEWQNYKYDASSINQSPTMGPLTAASIQALTTSDLKAWL